ncbi:D-TA family PLP-dependent enzyme [Mucilaginibacter sp. Bleaf8]|uniref:D-TA family PLP-dependent enzyme n=1 Tax=Mucilaginibacter sp. Bleaf8 TaxID=2834430 RepID=UPI001BCA8B0D|nr:D-TA family PLP-dependent enzyme [Mucilaginibacter sp. Bleaf8]MBS7566687.1 D-TA family PLP-dependent enzyme [Mucilaginibacter sp. Bleaf8]
MTSVSAYRIENLEEADTPLLAVYPDIVVKNIGKLISFFPDKKQIRPHVKTHKCPQVVKLLIEAGITKFKCATIAEAEMLAIAGAVDILLAYQPIGPKVFRFIKLMTTYPDCSFSCLVDNETSAQQISKAAIEFNLIAGVWIDLNVGMDRTGVLPATEGKRLFQFCGHLDGIKIAGLHAYDGHLTDPDPGVRLAQADEGFAAVRNLANDLVLAGFDLPNIVAGSTPTIQYYAQQPNIECSPGTFIYWDQHYQRQFPELAFENAALVISRVISKPNPETVCLDLGYKAVSSESSKEERVDFPELSDAQIISQSEEHLLVFSGASELQISDVVYGLPYHIGRTCNLYEACAIIKDHKIEEYWHHTARSRCINL